jgi:feruloyl-CoA synthase
MAAERLPAADYLGHLESDLSLRADGSMLVTARAAMPDVARCLPDRLYHWATVAPERVLFAERSLEGTWKTLSYRDAARDVRRLASGLLAHDLSAERPLVILSGNGIDHALLALAAMTIGVPYCPVSTPYSLVAKDFGKLRYCIELLTPGLVFASDAGPFAAALSAIARPDLTVVTARGHDSIGAMSLEALHGDADDPRVDAALAKITPDTIAKFLLTSGSTGEPKAVINTQRMLMVNQAMLQQGFPFLATEPPVLVDWLPWNHTFGSNHNTGIVITHGGTMYIDAGKPVPAGIRPTLQNLREIAPTVYFNVPKGYEALLPHLEADAAFATHFYSRLRFLFYAGAALPQKLWDGYEALSVKTTGRAIPFVTGLGATETSPASLMNLRRTTTPGNVGQPMAGVTLKLVPSGEKLEVRIKGQNITPGYWRSPDLTAKAFDDEGFYCFGDALKFITPGDADGGFLFDGRVSEDFKLVTGTWVSVGPLRTALVAGLEPLAKDAVIAGHDRDAVAALVFPDMEVCRKLAGGASDDIMVLAHPAVHAAFAKRLKAMAAQSTGSSSFVQRIALQRELPSLEAGEITDKGSLNQRAVLKRRAAVVETLYAEPISGHIISA